VKKEHGEQQKNSLETVRDTVSRAEEIINAELIGTSDSNDWLHCFGSCIFAIELHLGAVETQEILDLNQLKILIQRLNEVKERAAELRKAYPELKQGSQKIPEDIQQELLNSLREVGDGIL
jgi:hypothetical protein